jgi:deazaflavin-dependent oxidoreductase (nitroreductase family)
MSQRKTWVETLPYPQGLLKWLFKLPILLYRLGLGFVVGRLFIVLTTVGRKSGLPRRTAIEFHEFEGRCTVMSGWGTKTDWYRNIEANPYVTIQTWRGAQSARARRMTSDEELARVFEFARTNPTMRAMLKVAGFDLTLDQFLLQKDRFTFVIFEPTDQPTPEPLHADLVWLWGVLIPVFLLALAFFAQMVRSRDAAPGGGGVSRSHASGAHRRRSLAVRSRFWRMPRPRCGHELSGS